MPDPVHRIDSQTVAVATGEASTFAVFFNNSSRERVPFVLLLPFFVLGAS